MGESGDDGGCACDLGASRRSCLGFSSTSIARVAAAGVRGGAGPRVGGTGGSGAGGGARQTYGFVAFLAW